MSGLEPIVALGVACNVLQVIGVGRETVRIVRQVYQDGALDPALADKAAALDGLSTRIRDTTTTATKTGTSTCAPSKSAARDKQLLDLAEKCLGAARDLREEVNFLNGHPSRAKLAAALKVAAKTTWRKRRLESLERKLGDAEGLLQTGLLTRIYERSEKNGAGIAALDADLRSFLYEYRKGKADAAVLVSALVLRTREHITSETKGSVDAIKRHVTQETVQAEGSLKTHITQTTTQMETSLKGHVVVAIESAAEREQNARQEARRERLLHSLKFDGMNERSNQVRPSHAGTLEWVLKDGSNGEGPEPSVSETESWDSFSDWLRSTEPKYWISGKPGSGKTTLIKYLAEHERTRNFLDIWSPGAVLISYYFWRLGTKMQQSITGLLCSLLYQLLTEDEASLDRTLGNHPKISIKDAKSDWSEQELQSTLLDVMANYPKSIAVFLDGLDEVLPADGPLKLLEVIDTLERPLGFQGKVKLCLGARREPLVVKRLDTCPQLRLENLNRADLRRYAEGNIVIPPDYNTDIPPGSTLVAQMAGGVATFRCEDPPTFHEIRDWLVTELVGKAEGVFLWLCLTAKAITEAACQGETVMDLERRIDSLPSDLAELYTDMWKRTNGDSDFFRGRAALYLQLALCINCPVCPLRMMIATHPGMAARIKNCNLSERGLATSLLRLCKATIRDAGIRCAGLLESGPIPEKSLWPSDGDMSWHGREYNDLAPYAMAAAELQFVHRTARDFLTDTKEGRKILDASTVSEWHVHRKLVEAYLASYRIFRSAPLSCEHTYRGPVYNIKCYGTLRSCLASIASLLDAPPEEENNARGECDELLGFCEQLFNSGQLFGDRKLLLNTKDFQSSGVKARKTHQEGVKRQHEFLLETASTSLNLWPFILAKVKARSLDNQTLSELLLHVCNMGTSWWPGYKVPPTWRTTKKRDIFGIETRLKLAQLLLERGACPTWKGPRRVTHDLRPNEDLVHLLESPLKCLVSSVWHLDRNSSEIDSSMVSHLISLIQLLLSHGAVFDEEDSEELRVTYRVSGGCLVEAPFYWAGVESRVPPGEIEGMLVVLAYPASTILAKLLRTWEARFPEVEAFPKAWGHTKGGVRPGRLIAIMHAGRTPEHLWHVENEEELEEELLWVTRAAQHILQAHNRPVELPIPVEIQEGISRALERRRPERAEGSVDERLFKLLQKAGMTSIYWEWEEGSSFGNCLFI
ncbi:hypothetical protein MAPG_10889 [Magnaporthiopsis poae ATCC 64411]|uniref:NACHT domain-containing protein n=1 Tax=Magnaporthiopsis poae (strain ATCC 64411 / 73-15) TaxID=644358 RepID=A0A0C4EDS9_MAGP6|nr:hypothetical protein MAPG_10889 [Magnaporthiopsis poae ATCC 64411]